MRHLWLILSCALLIFVGSCKKDSENAVRCCKYDWVEDCNDNGSSTPPFNSIDCICEDQPWRDIAFIFGYDSNMTWEEFAHISVSLDTTGTFHCEF